MSLQIQREATSDALWAEAMPIIEAGFREFDPHIELGLDLNRQTYDALEAAGALRVYTARRSGELLGYVALIVGASPHRRAVKQATQDAIHVKPEHRGQVTAALIRHAEREMRDEGVKLLYHSCPMGSRLGRLLEILGYQPIGQTHAKLLK